MSESPPADNLIDSEMEKLKIDSESKPVEFSALTTDVIKVIIEKSQLKERLTLRKVSSRLRDLVDDQKSILTDIGFVFDEDHIRANFNSNIVVYADQVECSRFESHYHFNDAKVIMRKDYLEMALDDLKSAIKNPNLQLDALRIEFFLSHGTHLKYFSEKIEAILKSLNHKISTKTFEIRAESVDHVLAVLPYLKPGTLHCIEFRQYEASWRISDAEFERIAELEQWKQAKQLNLRYAQRMWPKKHLMHFEEFYIGDECLDEESVLEWRDIFSESKNFIICQMCTTDGIPSQIGGGYRTLLLDHFSNPMYLIKHPIRDDPNHYLEIKMRLASYCIIFNKLTRQSA